MGDFITDYLEYAKITPEVPKIYSRWSAIVGLGAFLGRDFYFQHGNLKVNTNMYAQLIGASAARKGTAIKLCKKVLTRAGYSSFSGERTSKEKFLVDLSGESDRNPLDENLFGNESSEYRQTFVAIDEFNDFIGIGNMEFISMLGNMWDYDGVYEQKFKNSKDLKIPNPTISILGGNTPSNFALAFPPQVTGQGILSRMLLIYGEPTGKKVAFPPAPTDSETEYILRSLQQIKDYCYGPAQNTQEAIDALEDIYKHWESLDDPSLESYNGRRFTHLLKVCAVCAASRASREITLDDVVRANTYLSHAETYMPRALGEFGKAKNSDVMHRLLSYIQNSGKVCKLDDLWEHVSKDLNDPKELGLIIQNLVRAKRIMTVPEVGGFLPIRRRAALEGQYLNPELLTEEELQMTI